MSAIRIEGLRKRYGPVVALDGLSLEVPCGTVFGFLGPNGAGKTTTLRILVGLARPTAGRAWVGNEPVGPESPARARIGYLPEEPRFYSWMTPQELLERFVCGLLGLPRAEARERTQAVLERVALTEVARRRIAGFSRGMRQRLGLAQALVNRPRVLLLDEPVSALDPIGRRDMLELIGSLKPECTVFMSSHILEDVERICDTVAVIHHGRLVVLEERQRLLDRYAVPVVEVEFEASAEAVARWADSLTGHPAVTAVEVRAPSVRLHMHGREHRAEVQRVAFESGMVVRRYEIARPSLEDVFLRLVEG